MTESSQQEPLAVPVKEVNWPFRIVMFLIVVGAVVAGYFIGVTVLPRWWAQRIGARVDGSMTGGTLYGIVIGFVCTLLPLVVLRQVFRRTRAWARITMLVLAVALAVPNLLTLAIVLGNGSGAHAGDRVMDVDAPGFRFGTAVGAIAGAVAGVYLLIEAWRHKRDRRKIADLEAANQAHQKKLRDAPGGDASQ